MRGREKKLRSRRFETLHDTSLCKVLQTTVGGDAEEATAEAIPDAQSACRMLQIDIQRWFRMGIRHLRENAAVESPCNYGYPERMVASILCFVGDSGASEHPSGRPLWHEDQLHLAEW